MQRRARAETQSLPHMRQNVPPAHAGRQIKYVRLPDPHIRSGPSPAHAIEFPVYS